MDLLINCCYCRHAIRSFAKKKYGYSGWSASQTLLLLEVAFDLALAGASQFDWPKFVVISLPTFQQALLHRPQEK